MSAVLKCWFNDMEIKCQNFLVLTAVFFYCTLFFRKQLLFVLSFLLSCCGEEVLTCCCCCAIKRPVKCSSCWESAEAQLTFFGFLL